MLVAQLLAAVERVAPRALAEPWDNVGLLVGHHNRPVRRLLVALDLRDAVLAEAREGGHEAILVHHPPIFAHLAAVTDQGPGRLVLRAAEQGVAVIAAHTNLDSAAGGLNDIMAQMIGMADTAPLSPHPDDPSVGLGRVGRVEPIALADLAQRVSRAFSVPAPFTGDPWAQVERVACCTGSGASFIGAAREAGVDAYVTGDLKYHDADAAAELALVQAAHAPVEEVTLRHWARGVQRLLEGEGVEVTFASASTDPWQNL